MNVAQKQKNKFENFYNCYLITNNLSHNINKIKNLKEINKNKIIKIFIILKKLLKKN